ncbi:sugar nucleotide-binding protein [Luteolibacter sp. GHJ8]|uniref:Sugar nucleotide-binding protein n=1 Tax=Luteolibacter rhizosphaerae TaxID=2989719 RepID=A0ABT3G3D6_9BACT|nr:NAD-dependent epimerase/dehydratase family protein [Luteolibacter rhizosphaerae]MCW1914365.1 sugar nucleotide-binding protein [Luteolibacter rhizosphaerae]
MPILLLCGHGYLGQAISREFREEGWEVVALSLSGGDGTLACDVSSAEAVGGLDIAPDLIVHCAASGRGGPEAYRAVYRDGCRNLLEAFPGVRLIFTSSSSVYAQTDGSEVTEESAAMPDRETGMILRETEELVLAAGGGVARLSGIYGPGRSVILKKFLNGEAVIEEDGRRFLNQIHRDDAARAVRTLAEVEGPGIYNVSDSGPMSQRACYEALADIFGRELPPSGPRDPNRKRGWTHKRVSNAKLRKIGWEPEFPSFLDAVVSVAPTLEVEA